jgi:hypothetical protein
MSRLRILGIELFFQSFYGNDRNFQFLPCGMLVFKGNKSKLIT